MSDKSILLTLIDFIVFVTLCKLIFKSFRNTIKGFVYFLLPAYIFFGKGWDKSFEYSHKMLFILILMTILVFLEYLIFYYH